jgi:hypothetical protein
LSLHGVVLENSDQSIAVSSPYGVVLDTSDWPTFVLTLRFGELDFLGQ